MLIGSYILASITQIIHYGRVPECGWGVALIFWGILGLSMSIGGIVIIGIFALFGACRMKCDYLLLSASGVISGASGIFLSQMLIEQDYSYLLAFLTANVCVSALVLGLCILQQMLKRHNKSLAPKTN